MEDDRIQIGIAVPLIEYHGVVELIQINGQCISRQIIRSIVLGEIPVAEGGTAAHSVLRNIFEDERNGGDSRILIGCQIVSFADLHIGQNDITAIRSSSGLGGCLCGGSCDSCRRSGSFCGFCCRCLCGCFRRSLCGSCCGSSCLLCGCCRNRLRISVAVEIGGIQQVCPIVAHLFVAGFVGVHTVMHIGGFIDDAVNVGKRNLCALSLFLGNQRLNGGIVGIDAALNLCGERCRIIGVVHTVCPQPIVALCDVDVRDGGNVQHIILAVHICQNGIHQIFQTISDAVVIVAQNIVGADLEQYHIRIIGFDHVAVAVVAANGFQNALTGFSSGNVLDGIAAVAGIVAVVGNGLSLILEGFRAAALRSHHINVGVSHFFQLVVEILSITAAGPIAVCDRVAQCHDLDIRGYGSGLLCSGDLKSTHNRSQTQNTCCGKR